MSKNGCQCANRKPIAETGFAATEHISAVDHNHAQLPNILKFRGLNNEAAAASYLLKIETLIATMHASLDDLDASMVERFLPDIRAKQTRQR